MTGELVTDRAPSEALGEPIEVAVRLPRGYRDDPRRRYPTPYLLHGRGDSWHDWAAQLGMLDHLIEQGAVPPLIAVLPDAPWSNRASYYVDSLYTGTPPGRPVETAFTRELVGHVDATYRTLAAGAARIVGGYSMGGAGALRYALAHPDLFRSALVLSPAVYVPEPPTASSARSNGAFGIGSSPFDPDRYAELGYPTALASLGRGPVHLAIAVGHEEPLAWAHTVALCRAAREAPGVTVRWRGLPGGHDWNTWRPAFRDGLTHLAGMLDS